MVKDANGAKANAPIGIGCLIRHDVQRAQIPRIDGFDQIRRAGVGLRGSCAEQANDGREDRCAPWQSAFLARELAAFHFALALSTPFVLNEERVAGHVGKLVSHSRSVRADAYTRSGL